MSFRGKKYDGNFIRGSIDPTERRDTLDNESQAGRYASSKRTDKKAGRLEEDDSLFREEGDKDRYLITYADLITLLLGLFIILYAVSNVDVSKYHGVVAAMDSFFGSGSGGGLLPHNDTSAIPKPSDKLYDNLNKLIVQYNYQQSIRLEENERGVVIHIMDDILFASGNAELTEESRIVLNRIAAVIKLLPNDIRIEGHTDNVPINSGRYPSNWHLSVDRALNTAYYLIRNEGVSAGKVSVVGYSEYHPIVPNDSDSNRALNRRVDLVILK